MDNLKFLTLDCLADTHAKIHNQWLKWLEMAEKEDNKDTALKFRLEAEGCARLAAHYRALIVEKVMEEHGYSRAIGGRYECRDN